MKVIKAEQPADAGVATPETLTPPDAPKTNDDAADLAALSPYERQRLKIDRETLELQRRATEAAERSAQLLSAEHRITQNNDTQVAERIRVVEEDRKVIADGRKERTVRLCIGLILENVKDRPVAKIYADAVCNVMGPTEENAGKTRILALRNWDTQAADALITADAMLEVQDSINEARRLGEQKVEGEIMAKVRGRSPSGLMGRRWNEITKPLLHRVISPSKTLEDLVESGLVQVVDPDATPATVAAE